jgi:hypothetical protein
MSAPISPSLARRLGNVVDAWRNQAGRQRELANTSSAPTTRDADLQRAGELLADAMELRDLLVEIGPML